MIDYNLDRVRREELRRDAQKTHQMPRSQRLQASERAESDARAKYGEDNVTAPYRAK